MGTFEVKACAGHTGMKFEILWSSLTQPDLRTDARVIVNKARKVGWGQCVM